MKNKITYLLPILFLALSSLVHAQFSDEFDDASTISNWNLLESGNPNYYQTLELDGTLIEGNPVGGPAGHLTIRPGTNYWYGTVTGPFLHQSITGDFGVTTSVRALNRWNLSLAPTATYNSVGMVVRDPDISNGNNYVMVNLGHQSFANGIGSESKNTINSNSTLYLLPDSSHGEVRLIRRGDTIRTYKRTGTETGFTLLNEFVRSDFPPTVEVGVVCNGWTANPDLHAEVDWIRFDTPPVCHTDSYEPNDELAFASNLYGGTMGGISKMRICPQDDVDWYRFSVPSGRTIRVRLENLPANFNVELLDLTGGVLASASTAGIQNELIVYPNAVAGDYYVRVFGYNGAWSATGAYNLIVNVIMPTPAGAIGIKPTGFNSQIKAPSVPDIHLFPNPASDEFRILFNAETELKTIIEIYDLSGNLRLHARKAVSQGNNEIHLKVNELPPGTYLVRLSCGEKIWTEKISLF